MTPDGDVPVVQMDGITKAYGDLVANDAINLVIRHGRVHAVVGENGAGKSTLMQILCGAVQPDGGAVALHGRPVDFRSTSDAIVAGVGMVYQHFKLVASMTVGQNVVLGDEPVGPFGLINTATARQEVADLCSHYGLHVPYDMAVRDASVGVKQKVEILRVLRRRPEVVILDEPTAVLSPVEIDDLLRFVKKLADQGTAVVFITHKLREVFAVADDITVLRRGQVVGQPDPADVTPDDLAALMVGRSVDVSLHRPQPQQEGPPLWSASGLSAANLTGGRGVVDVDLEIFSGQLLGIAGVDGNGQRELVDILTGATTRHQGQVVWRGNPIARGGVRQAIRRGIAHIPEDRQAVGLIPEWALTANATLRKFHGPPFGSWWHLNRSAMRKHTRSILDGFNITATPDTPAASLSGGNQQRFVVGRELATAPAMVVAEQPTRGVDIGASKFIYDQLLSIRDAGAAVVVVSFDLDELLTLADRLIVMYSGRIVADLSRDEADRSLIGKLMTGAVGANV